MAWDEWEELKAGALARGQDQTRLNSVGSAGGTSTGGAGTGGGPDLKTDNAGKKGAVTALERDIRPGTATAGSHAEEPSSAAVREFSGWETGAGLKAAYAEWELQVKNLQGLLAKDQGALTQTRREFQYVDHGVESRIAALDAGPYPRRAV